MIDVKPEDFEKYRSKLFKYACSLLKGRGFTDKHGELVEYAKDVVSETSECFLKYNMNAYVSDFHLENSLVSICHKCYLRTIDLNRRGAQYILNKDTLDPTMFKSEFEQMNVRVKPTHMLEFDVESNFRRDLSERDVVVLNSLLEGYSQRETANNMNVKPNIVFKSVTRLRKKYKELYESTNSKRN